jgi:hypothetical protein
MARSELDRLCEKLKITASAQYGAVEVPEGWAPGTHPYKVTLRFQRRALTVPFFMGSARTDEPTAADVLSCLCSDASAAGQSFEDWCSDLGYDADSRKAEATYKACEAIAPRLTRFLGDHYEEVCRAEH